MIEVKIKNKEGVVVIRHHTYGLCNRQINPCIHNHNNDMFEVDLLEDKFSPSVYLGRKLEEKDP